MEGDRRRLTLANHMSVIETSNLRDLLRFRDDDDNDRRDTLAGQTLGAVLGFQKNPTPIQAGRTLLDIIRDEESGAAYRGLVAHNNNKSWKSFKDCLRLRRVGAAWSSSSHPVPSCDISVESCRIQISRPSPAVSLNRSWFQLPTSTTIANTGDSIPTTISPQNESDIHENGNIIAESDTTSAAEPVSNSMRLSAALEAEREEQQRAPENQEIVLDSTAAVAEEGGNASAEAAPIRVSLMALLEETDRQAGVVGSTLMGTEEEEEEEGEGGKEVGEFVCCVCMLRHKGAAFIPCGHTFCRLCSRELWVSRGNCPLCNGFILEILDIF